MNATGSRPSHHEQRPTMSWVGKATTEATSLAMNWVSWAGITRAIGALRFDLLGRRFRTSLLVVASFTAACSPAALQSPKSGETDTGNAEANGSRVVLSMPEGGMDADAVKDRLEFMNDAARLAAFVDYDKKVTAPSNMSGDDMAGKASAVAALTSGMGFNETSSRAPDSRDGQVISKSDFASATVTTTGVAETVTALKNIAAGTGLANATSNGSTDSGLNSPDPMPDAAVADSQEPDRAAQDVDDDASPEDKLTGKRGNRGSANDSFGPTDNPGIVSADDVDTSEGHSESGDEAESTSNNGTVNSGNGQANGNAGLDQGTGNGGQPGNSGSSNGQGTSPGSSGNGNTGNGGNGQSGSNGNGQGNGGASEDADVTEDDAADEPAADQPGNSGTPGGGNGQSGSNGNGQGNGGASDEPVDEVGTDDTEAGESSDPGAGETGQPGNGGNGQGNEDSPADDPQGNDTAEDEPVEDNGGSSEDGDTGDGGASDDEPGNSGNGQGGGDSNGNGNDGRGNGGGNGKGGGPK